MPKTIPVPERSFYARWGIWIMLVAALLLPVVVWGAVRAAQSNNNNIKQWLPKDMPETEVYRGFKDQFGTDEYAVVSWKGCTLADERLEPFAAAVLAQRLRRRDYAERGLISYWVAKIADWLDGERTSGPANQNEGALLFADATTGPQFIEKLQEAEQAVTSEDDEPRLTRDDIIKRFQGLFIGREKVGQDDQGRDDYDTCVVIKLAEAGDNDRTAAVEALYEAAESVGLQREDVYLGGETVSNAALDTESQRAINSLTGISVLVAFVMALASLRSIRLTLVVFLVAGFSAALAQAMVHFTGGQLNLVLVVMPVLVYVLAMSAGVHVINYYRDAVRTRGRQGAALRAVADGWLPCSLAAVTTAVGLISLNVSHVEPVQKFGQYGALGILVSLAFVFLLLPSLLEQRWIGGGVSARSSDTSASEPSLAHLLVVATIRHRVVVNVTCCVALIAFGIGASRINTSVKPMRFYKQDSTIVQDATWFETHLGPLVPMEVVIRFDNQKNKMSFDERLGFVKKVRDRIAGMDEGVVGATISAATFDVPMSELTGPVILRKFEEKARAIIRENKLTPVFKENGYLAEVEDDNGEVQEQLWRITVRVAALGDVDYDLFLDQIRKQVDLPKEDDAADGGEPSGVTAIYTGAVPLVFVAQNELLTGLRNSFLMAFVLIGIVMIVLFRSVGAGLTSMLPNIFPAVIVFGAMGWLGTVVDVGSMLTASVAMGIAVDDTLHYLTWFRRSLRTGMSRTEAVVAAYHRCAGAMAQTTAIAGLGLLVYSYSSFQPVSQFGLLMCLLLLMALVGDLVFLPALLAGRLGALFEQRIRSGA